MLWLAALGSAQLGAEKIAPAVSGGDSLGKVTLALLFVLAVIYALAWLVKRQQGMKGIANLPMRTLAVLPLGHKEKLILVEIGNKQILLGMTPHNINCLSEFDEPVLQVSDKSKQDFAAKLKAMIAQGKE